MEVFIVAGEPSGDRQGAALAKEMWRREPQAAIAGVGGPAMSDAGVSIVFDSTRWAAIGVGEALKKVPRLWLKQRALVRRLLACPPAVMVLVDFGAFNLPLARSVQGSGIPILYYFPPRSWSREPATGGLTELVDAIATPFRWSREALSGGSAQVRWVGHPLVDQVRPTMEPARARARWGLAEGERLVAVVPGSRRQELRYLLPVLAAAAAILNGQLPGLRFAVTAAPGVSRQGLEQRFLRVGIEPIVVDGVDPDLLQAAEVALATSGTATLELAILGVPMVVVYKVSPTNRVQWMILQRMRGPVRFIAMPNVIAQRAIVSELLQERARGDLVAAEARRLLEDPGAASRTRQELHAVAQELGPPGAAGRAAEMALALAHLRPIKDDATTSAAAK
jgi:lipid-A-disaccharide synthase